MRIAVGSQDSNSRCSLNLTRLCERVTRYLLDRSLDARHALRPPKSRHLIRRSRSQLLKSRARLVAGFRTWLSAFGYGRIPRPDRLPLPGDARDWRYLISVRSPPSSTDRARRRLPLDHISLPQRPTDCRHTGRIQRAIGAGLPFTRRVRNQIFALRSSRSAQENPTYFITRHRWGDDAWSGPVVIEFQPEAEYSARAPLVVIRPISSA
jgi:hypothetical protein